MCKTTTIDLGMCVPKCFVIVVNLFTFLLGSLILGASIFGMLSVESIGGNGTLNLLFYAPIAFGGFIVFISFFGCCGACFKSRCMLMTFAILLVVIFACQVGVVYFVYDLYAQLDKSVNDYLTDSMKSSEDNEIFSNTWELIQYLFGCCGVNSPNDWQIVTETLPISCCPMRNETVVTDEISPNATCTQADAFDNGCRKLVTNYLDVMFHPVTVGVIVVLTIQLINLIVSCCMFFVYGWTKRSRNRKTSWANYGFVDESTTKINDQFIVKTNRF